MREETVSVLQVFLLYVTLGENIIYARTLTTPLPATHERNASSLPAGGIAGFRQAYDQDSFPGYAGSSNERRRCPLCDKSVYPYCGDKLFHDACCCTNPYQYPLPNKCRQADCAFLHANSCHEHLLISDCCCGDDYRSLLRGLLLSDTTAASDSTTVKN